MFLSISWLQRYGIWYIKKKTVNFNITFISDINVDYQLKLIIFCNYKISHVSNATDFFLNYR